MGFYMTIESVKQKFIEAFVNDGGITNSKVSMSGYYVGITDDLEKRTKEHNATFLYSATAKTKKLAVELKDALGEMGFDNGVDLATELKLIPTLFTFIRKQLIQKSM